MKTRYWKYSAIVMLSFVLMSMICRMIVDRFGPPNVSTTHWGLKIDMYLLAAFYCISKYLNK